MSFVNAMRYLQKQAYNYTRDTIPYESLEAVLTARRYNQTIVETDLKISDGKKRQLKINYYPPVCEDDTTCGTNIICEPGTVLQPKQAWFEISRCTTSAVYQLNKDDIRYDDGNYSFSDHARFQILSVLPTVRKKLAVDVANLLTANAGLLPDGTASKTLPFINKENGVMNPVGLWEVERAYRDTGYSNPFIVGGTDVFYWKKAVDIGGLNNFGQNVARMGATNAWYDSLINEAYGVDGTREHVISFDPSMIKFVSFNQNAGMFATDLRSIDDLDRVYQRGGTDYIDGVLLDPATGLLWDLYVSYDKCLKAWTFYFELIWDMFFMPAAVCNKQGVNGIFHWLTCGQPAVECPAISPISPVGAGTFEFQTSGQITYPYIIQKLEVAGITAYPAKSVANITQLAAAINDVANGIVFTVSGTKLQYEGYAGITVQLNDVLTMNFTEA